MSEQPDKPGSLIIQTTPAQPLSEHTGPEEISSDMIVEAEWVRRYPARPRRHWLNWAALLLKIGAALALTWLFLVLPAGSLPIPIQTWKNPVIIFCLICFIGKTLLDTLFYDHYQP